MTRLFLLYTALLSLASQAAPLPLSTSYWKSASFQKEFNGSYRINAAIEPILTSAERGLLVEMQDLMAKGQRSQTIAKLKASPLLSASAALQFNLANVYSEQGELAEAVRSYQEAIQLLPAFQRAHQNLAFAFYRDGKSEEAEPHLLEAVRLGANNGSVHGLLGYRFLEKEQYEPALRSFREALITQPEERNWKSGIAQALMQLNRLEEAFSLFQVLLKNDPENSELQLQMAFLQSERDETAEAIVLFELLRRKGQLSADHELFLGTLLVSDGNLSVGAATLKRVLSNRELKQPDSVLNAIRFCSNQDLVPLALELHQLVDPDQLSASAQIQYRILKAQLLLASDPESPEALEILKKLIAENPLDTESLFLLGQYHLNQAESFKALLIFDQAIHAEGEKSSAAMLAKSQIQVKMQRYPAAVETLEAYLALNSGDEPIQEYLEAVRELSEATSLGRD